jgi:hypothetical protein
LCWESGSEPGRPASGADEHISRVFASTLVSSQTFYGSEAASVAASIICRAGGEPLALLDGQRGAAGLFGPWSAVNRRGLRKQPHMGAARWLCSGHRPGRAAWLEHYRRNLLAPARRADLPPAARAGGQHWPRRPAESSETALLAGSDDAVARCAASGRCGGFSQSCGRRCSFDRGRSDLCWRHQQGSCGRFARVSAIGRTPGLKMVAPFSFLPKNWVGNCIIIFALKLGIKYAKFWDRSNFAPGLMAHRSKSRRQTERAAYRFLPRAREKSARSGASIAEVEPSSGT